MPTLMRTVSRLLSAAVLCAVAAACASSKGGDPIEPYLAALSATGPVALGAEPADGGRARAALDVFVAALADYSAATIRQHALELYADDAYFNDQIKELTGAVAIGDYLARSAEMLIEPRIEVQGAASVGGDHYLRWLMTFRTEPDDPPISARGITHVRFGADGKVIFHADFWDVSAAVWERLPVVGTVIRKARARL
jgi:hypothetical protein